MPPVSSARPVRQSGSSARTTIARRDNGVTRRRHAIAAAAVTAYRRAIMGTGNEWVVRYCTLREMRDGRQQIADSRIATRVFLLSAICYLLSASAFAAYSSRDLFIPIFGRGVGGDGRRYETSFTIT